MDEAENTSSEALEYTKQLREIESFILDQAAKEEARECSEMADS